VPVNKEHWSLFRFGDLPCFSSVAKGKLGGLCLTVSRMPLVQVVARTETGRAERMSDKGPALAADRLICVLEKSH